MDAIRRNFLGIKLRGRELEDVEGLYIRALYDVIDDLDARSLSEFEELEARELGYDLDELD